jgi:hypothetical protein
MKRPDTPLATSPTPKYAVSRDSVKKAQIPGRVTPEQREAARLKREEITRKKDSILNRNAAAKGMTREQVRAQQERDKKKPDAALPGLETDKANKRGKSKGSCTTGQTNKGECLKDNS